MEFIIDENYEDVRLDKFLRKKYKDLPLSHIYNMIRKGEVKINGKKAKENYRLKINDILNIKNEEKTEEKFIILSEKELKLIENAILYDKDDIVIINKPSEMVVHKGSGHEYGMIEMLKSYYNTNDFAFINRIDKSTSGLVIGGKNNKMVRELSEIMRERDIKKYYYVKVKGKPLKKEFEIKSNILKNETKSEEDEEGKESITKFKLIETDGRYSILEAELLTGRTHQIRVQLSEKGMYICGDYKYGEKKGNKMCLFSHRVIIEKYSIDINLEIPDFFYY